MTTPYPMHHWTLSVSSTAASAAFYAVFGFEPAYRWEAPDGSLAITHLTRGDGLILELFEYAANRGRGPAELQPGNDLEQPGVKHVAFRVSDLTAAAASFRELDCGPLTDIEQGRTGISYFFVADPDGNWVEIVQDDRDLSSLPRPD